jgi:hypothetical protein
MLTNETITRTQTLTLPRCATCNLPLPLHRDCPCQEEQRRCLWHGIRWGFGLSLPLWGLIAAALWWLAR